MRHIRPLHLSTTTQTRPLAICCRLLASCFCADRLLLRCVAGVCVLSSQWGRSLSTVAGAASSTSAVKYDGMRTVPATAPHLPSTSGPSPDLLPHFTPSLLDSIFNRSSMKKVPLTEAYPTGLPEPTDQPLTSDEPPAAQDATALAAAQQACIAHPPVCTALLSAVYVSVC